jgi:hypothetical protein
MHLSPNEHARVRVTNRAIFRAQKRNKNHPSTFFFLAHFGPLVLFTTHRVAFLSYAFHRLNPHKRRRANNGVAHKRQLLDRKRSVLKKEDGRSLDFEDRNDVETNEEQWRGKTTGAPRAYPTANSLPNLKRMHFQLFPPAHHTPFSRLFFF